MPRRRRDPTDPAEWLRRAHSNLARARADRNSPEILYEDLCFDAQQAAEKAIKAVLVHRLDPLSQDARHHGPSQPAAGERRAGAGVD